MSSYTIPEHLAKYDWYGPHLRWLRHDVPHEAMRANLRGANLRGADLSWANLSGANLRDIKVAWQSHDLLAEILLRAAGDDIAKRKIAGLILVSRDWCWEKFLAIDEPLRDWALDEFAKWVKPDDGAPECVRERAK